MTQNMTQNKMDYSLEERCSREFGDAHGKFTQALNRSKEDFENGWMSQIVEDNLLPPPLNAKVNTFPFYKESTSPPSPRSEAERQSDGRLAASTCPDATIKCPPSSGWTFYDEIGVNYIKHHAKQVKKNETFSSDETEVFAYSCPNDDTLIFLPQNKDLVAAMGWYAECGITYEIDEDPARRFKVDKAQYKTISSYFGKKFEMSQYENMAKFIDVLREMIAVQQRLGAMTPNLPAAMAPSIHFFEEPAWDRNAVLNIPPGFQTYASVYDVLTAKMDDDLTEKKKQEEARILDAGGDKVAMHVLSHPYGRVLFEQEHPLQASYLFCGNGDNKPSMKNCNLQLRPDPPINEEHATCLYTNRTSLTSQSILPITKEPKDISPHTTDIFGGPFSSQNFMSYADLTRKTAWENTPVFIIAIFLHKQEITTFVRVAETSNKNLLHHIQVNVVGAICNMERIMLDNPFFGFVPMIIFKTTSKEIVDHMSSSFQAKQFASFADVDIALKIEENFVKFVQNNEAVRLVMKPEEKEEENIRRYLQANFEIDNNPDHKYKAQDLFRFFGEAQQELGITVDVNFRNRLSKYLINLGLQKKRFSDGYYYFGLVRRSNEMK